LFDVEVVVNVQKLVEKAEEESNKLVAYLYKKEGENNLASLINIRLKLENELRKSIIKQLEELIK